MVTVCVMVTVRVMVTTMHGDGDGGSGGGDGDGDCYGGVGDVSNYLAQFSVLAAYHYTHPAHVRAAHSPAQDDPLYSALSEDCAGIP